MNLNQPNQNNVAQKHDQDLLDMIAGSMPPNKSQELVEATVLEITDRHVLLNLGMKADGVLSLNEFKDMPELKIGDQVDVYILNQEDRKGNLLISRKKARQMKGWKSIEEAYEKGTTLVGTIDRRVKGGFNININGRDAFLPGSLVDTTPVTDYDAYLNLSLEVVVLSIKPEKHNAVVSHKPIKEREQRAFIESLEAGQVLQGKVKNVTEYGAFFELSKNKDGLVHVTDAVWDKRVTDARKALNADGKPLFEVGVEMPVVFKGFGEGKNKDRIALSTKELLPNPWHELPATIQEGSVVKGKVSDIKGRGVCVTVEGQVEGFLHVSEMSLSQYIKKQNPGDLVKLGEELELEVLRIDREEQDLRLSTKRLVKNPWEDANFFTEFALNTRHKAKVGKILDKGVYFEIKPGVEGYLANEHISWTQKVIAASDHFKLDEEHQVIILSIDDEHQLLKLGMRELEDSPWDAFEKEFPVGSEHEGVIIKNNIRGGAIVELRYGLQTFVPNKELLKEGKGTLDTGEKIKFVVKDFIKDEHRVMLSHPSTSKGELERDIEVNSMKKASMPSMKKSTLSDLDMLVELKEKLSETDRKEKEASKKAEKEVKKEKKASAEAKQEVPKEEPKKEEPQKKEATPAKKTTPKSKEDKS